MLREMLEGVRSRAPWLAVGRPMLLAAGFEIRQGPEKTIAHAMAKKSDPAIEAKLRAALIEHLVAGEKHVRLFRVSAPERAMLETWIRSKRVGVGPLTAIYPGVSDGSVIKNALGTMSSVGYESCKSGLAAIYTGARHFLERVPVPKADLKIGAGDYERIFGIKQTFVQTYDAIWLAPKANIVCSCADLPLEAQRGFAGISQDALRGELQKQLGKAPTPLNLWKAIDGIYRAPDGRAVDYGFTNNADSVKHHKGRSGDKCLRNDIYDKAGAAAVGDDLSFFKIAMRWKRKRADLDGHVTDPELLLPGNAAMLHRAAVLDHVVIRNCHDTDDLDFVVGKLLAQL